MYQYCDCVKYNVCDCVKYNVCDCVKYDGRDCVNIAGDQRSLLLLVFHALYYLVSLFVDNSRLFAYLKLAVLIKHLTSTHRKLYVLL